MKIINFCNILDNVSVEIVDVLSTSWLVANTSFHSSFEDFLFTEGILLISLFDWYFIIFFFSGKNSESKYEPVNDENNRNLFQTSSDAEILAQLEDEDEKDPDFLVNNEELNDLESTQSSPNASMSQAPPSKGKIH